MSTTNTTTGGQPLLAANLSTPPIHIPNGKGGAYKTELALERTPERTLKILWWHEGDPRPEPHNHPWDFESSILHGGYTETRYWLEDGAVKTEQRTYRAGDVNRVPRSVFHVVTDVLPGTVTRLTCGPATPNNEWEYLDIMTGEVASARSAKYADSNYLTQMREINPHMRPKAV